MLSCVGPLDNSKVIRLLKNVVSRGIFQVESSKNGKIAWSVKGGQREYYGKKIKEEELGRLRDVEVDN